MSDNETITILKTLLKPIQDKLESLEIKLESLEIKATNIELKVDTLKLDQKTSERAIRKDIHYLNDEVDTLIEVLEQKGILPKAK